MTGGEEAMSEKTLQERIKESPITGYITDLVIGVSVLGAAGIAWKVGLWILETIAKLELP